MLTKIAVPVKCRARQWHSGAREEYGIGLKAASVAAIRCAKSRA